MTRERVPLQWAAIKNNLGIVRVLLDERLAVRNDHFGSI
jgi:hypothetical protein